MATYNGHKSWAYWNVSLWIGNDERLYNYARSCIRSTRNRDEAARKFVETIGEGCTTPDGARYSISAVRAAMRGL